MHIFIFHTFILISSLYSSSVSNISLSCLFNFAGDGVVPYDYSHLDGAVQVTLDDVYHSISAPDFYWYGGKKVIDKWLPVVAKL